MTTSDDFLHRIHLNAPAGEVRSHASARAGSEIGVAKTRGTECSFLGAAAPTNPTIGDAAMYACVANDTLRQLHDLIQHEKHFGERLVVQLAYRMWLAAAQSPIERLGLVA